MDWKELDEILILRARQVRVAGYNDCHDIDENFIELGGFLDGAEPPCAGCGLRLPATAPPSAHRIGCVNYAPHPNSITAWVANYNGCHNPRGDVVPGGSNETITYLATHGA